ncbi:MAG: tRNA uridine-5-carboxymethylaminomethyl(34) synthesis GTPase MnmE, partial [Alphaproteobacteria bacterium]|nr:tRNA uridine-5-carboxymethylaminomethyl(34) synthesis GTPase MnmE [Alphaproteobacteria bacterium]
MSGGSRDTIYALSSGPGRAAIAVVRISGPKSSQIVLDLTMGGLPPPRRAVVRALRVPGSDEVIDRGLLLWFPKPHSATGEDVAEFHLHGGFAVQQALFRTLEALEGVRPAEPGEFSRRAFENDRMDLIQAEGLADLIAAETEGQR